jgi:FtsZ-binding cell division protein ZapB
MILHINHDGPIRIENEQMVNSYTEAEWKLVAIIHETGPGWMDQANRCYVPGATTTKYVIGQSMEKAKERATDALNSYRKEISTLKESAIKLTKERDDAQRDARRAKEDMATTNERLEIQTKETKDRLAMVSKYEKDIAKIRKAIGEIRMKEILDSNLT